MSQIIRSALCALVIGASLASALPAAAQPSPAGRPPAAARIGADRKPVAAVNLYPGVAPGSEGWTRVERTSVNPGNGGRMIRNIVTPTLEAYLPDPDKATGAAVIIAPGGANLFLSYDTEGVWAAQWMAAHGVAGLVLKYRTVETPAEDAAFMGQLRQVFMAAAKPGGGPLNGAAVATSDGVQALMVARQHARDWRIDPNRLGIMGFSAGARVAVGVVAAGAKPAFAAPIYGGAFGDDLDLKDSPPMFLAVAADDALAASTELELFGKLRTGAAKPELHVYYTGGHGFGLEAHNNTTAHWIDEFYWWMDSHGWLKANR